VVLKLSYRKQFVEINNSKSDLLHIDLGVPQGSTLGPLLFLLYINDLPAISKLSEFRLFADDTNNFVRSKNYDELKLLTEIELSHILSWMQANSLSINYSKTNFTIFSPHLRKTVHTINHLAFGPTEIKRASSIKYLGIFIDDNLNWKDHIKMVLTKLTKYCGIFYKIRHKIPKGILKTIYFALIHSTIQYGIEIYANTKCSYLKDLNTLNNRILRILQFKNIRTQITILYSAYNTLPIPYFHEFKLNLLAFKFFFYPTKLPFSFHNYFILNLTIHAHFTRTHSNIHIPSCRSQHGKRSLTYKASTLWNRLPKKCKTPQSIKSFKINIITYLSAKLVSS
jgi:hypothetical protein